MFSPLVVLMCCVREWKLSASSLLPRSLPLFCTTGLSLSTFPFSDSFDDQHVYDCCFSFCLVCLVIRISSLCSTTTATAFQAIVITSFIPRTTIMVSSLLFLLILGITILPFIRPQYQDQYQQYGTRYPSSGYGQYGQYGSSSGQYGQGQLPSSYQSGGYYPRGYNPSDPYNTNCKWKPQTRIMSESDKITQQLCSLPLSPHT